MSYWNTPLLFSWQFAYSLTPGVFILRNISDGQRQGLFAWKDSGGYTMLHFANMSQHLIEGSTESEVWRPHTLWMPAAQQVSSSKEMNI